MDKATIATITLGGLFFAWVFVPFIRDSLYKPIRRALCCVWVHGYEVEPGTPWCHCPECGYRRTRTPFFGHSMDDMMKLDDIVYDRVPRQQRKALLNELVNKHYRSWWGPKGKYIVKQDAPSASPLPDSARGEP